MINCNFDKIKQRFREFWAKENHDRPLVTISAPKEKADWSKLPKAPEKLLDRWTNMNYVLVRSRIFFENTMYFGEGFPHMYPNLGPDILGAVCGCGIEFGEDTSWAVHNVKDWETLSDIKFDADNKWWKRIEQMTADAMSDAKGDYIVGITDLHPGTDTLVSLRGPESCCMDLFEHPDLLKKFNWQIFDVFKEVYNRLYALTAKQGGATNWMGIFGERRWYVVSSDFSCLISEPQFEEFVIPELLAEIDYLDGSIYHLDGPGALRHLGRIARIKKLDGIQWVYGAGQPSPRHWIKVLKKIQDAGKCIDIYGPPEDLPELMKYLKPEGLLYHTYCNSESDAKDLLKAVTRK